MQYVNATATFDKLEAALQMPQTLDWRLKLVLFGLHMAQQQNGRWADNNAQVSGWRQ